MPLIRQMPKRRGFRSPHPKAQSVRLSRVLNKFSEGDVITPQKLREKHLIEDASLPIKVVGKTPINKKFVFKSVKLSAAAKAAVEKAGGKIADVE